MKVAIYSQMFQEDICDYVSRLLTELNRHKAEVSIEEQFCQYMMNCGVLTESRTFNQTEGLDSTFDIFISLGGDGTILRATTFVKNLGIPIVGVNTGRLGFLSTFNKEEVQNVVKEFVEGNFSIVERSLVSVFAETAVPELNELNFALNEITISRKDTTSMITVETYLNDEYLTAYWADGLIISTPTGSTGGYSLSCGGPVIEPTAKSLVLTPIAPPHNLNARPLVISDDTIIRLRVSGREDNHLISLDSRIAP